MTNWPIWQFLGVHQAELFLKMQEQLYLVSFATLFAMLIGIPLGILAYRVRSLRTSIVGVSTVLWTIPSLALLAFLLPFFGIGATPAVIALTLYALLPIVRNTMSGLDEVPVSAIEAARALGFTPWQRLYKVTLPLALPVMVNGIRTAVVIAVGIATLAAFIGAGGLGDFINRGLATNNNQIVLLGAIPAAVLALLLDFCIANVERLVSYRYQHEKKPLWRFFAAGFAGLLLLFPFLSQFNQYVTRADKQARIVIASKNFTEQFILGELMAQLIEAKTDIKVVRRFNLGSTAICHQAMLKGEIDIYPEYTGTAYLTVLKQIYKHVDANQLYQAVQEAYQNQFQITWLAPFGFNNSQSLAVRKAYADEKSLQTISDIVVLAKQLTIGAPAEFLVRPDSMPHLKNVYQLNFKQVKSMEPGLMYQALHRGHLDIIMAFTTDGRIPVYQLKILQDDKLSFPSYYAAPLIRDEVLNQYPEVKQVLKPLLGIIDNETMQALNAAVDIEKQAPARVAQQFLLKKGLISRKKA